MKQIVPFIEMHSTAALPVSGGIIQDLYAKALGEARETIRMTLKERLLKFSFVAHVVSLANRCRYENLGSDIPNISSTAHSEFTPQARTTNRSLDNAEREHRASGTARRQTDEASLGSAAHQEPDRGRRNPQTPDWRSHTCSPF